MDFLTNRSQQVRCSTYPITLITTDTVVPRGCVLSPNLFTLYIDYLHSFNSSVKLVENDALSMLCIKTNTMAEMPSKKSTYMPSLLSPVTETRDLEMFHICQYVYDGGGISDSWH